MKRLFPTLRFFTIEWAERAAPGKEKEVWGLSQGIGYTLVCSIEGKIVQGYYHDGGYKPFGDFLAAQKVSIRDLDDAKLVWVAFCDFHQKHWKENPAIKISESVWHLGDTTIGGVHYYYEVLLDGAKAVTSARLRSDDPKRPKSR